MCGVFIVNTTLALDFYLYTHKRGFLGGSDSKESACNAGDPGWIPGLGRVPGEGNGNPLHYSCQENSMDKGQKSPLGRKEIFF